MARSDAKDDKDSDKDDVKFSLFLDRSIYQYINMRECSTSSLFFHCVCVRLWLWLWLWLLYHPSAPPPTLPPPPQVNILFANPTFLGTQAFD